MYGRFVGKRAIELTVERSIVRVVLEKIKSGDEVMQRLCGHEVITCGRRIYGIRVELVHEA